jgi:surfeit locus 1 family protein
MRFHPLAMLGIVAALLALLALGTWQVARGREKAHLLAAAQAAGTQLPRRWLACPPPDAALGRARVGGRVEGAAQWLLDNRIHAGRAGYEVLMPVTLDSGERVLVNRGWVPAGPRRDVPPQAAAPVGQVALTGTWRAPERNPFVPARAPERLGAFWRSARLDPAALAQQLGAPVCPLILALDADQPHGFVREWRVATIGPQRHYAYAAQWYGLALALVALVAYAHRRR